MSWRNRGGVQWDLDRYQLEERSRFVPRAGCETPEPGWKKADWALDVVPAKPPR